MGLPMSSGGLASGGVPQPQGGVADQNPYAALAGSAGPAASNLSGQAFQPNVYSLTPGLNQANQQYQQYQDAVFNSQPGQFAPPKMTPGDLLGGGLTQTNPATGQPYGADPNIIDPATGLPRGYVQGQGFAPGTVDPTSGVPQDLFNQYQGVIAGANYSLPQPKPADLSLPGPGFFSPPAQPVPQAVVGAGQVLDQMPQAMTASAPAITSQMTALTPSAPRLAPQPRPQPQAQSRPAAQPQRNTPRPQPQPARRVQAQPVRRPMPVRGLR